MLSRLYLKINARIDSIPNMCSTLHEWPDCYDGVRIYHLSTIELRLDSMWKESRLLPSRTVFEPKKQCAML